jgi:hypothetical protein
MDTDTLILMGLLFTAFSCYFTILIVEKRQAFKQYNQNELDRLGRAERVRKLTNRS